MRSTACRTSVRLFLALVAFGNVARAQSPASTVPDYKLDPKFTAAMAEAHSLAAKQPIFAVDAYKKANKLAGGQCWECLSQVVSLELKMGDVKAAAAAANGMLAIAVTPKEKANAQLLRGQVLYLEAGDKPKPGQLQAAEDAMKAAIAADPGNAMALYYDGQVLARMGQMDAAKQQFQRCLQCESPNDSAYLRTKHFAEDPSLSFAKRAPAFTVTALDGSKFALDAMGGRVVLIDFWATWCGPCKEELPHMKKIAKEFAGQPLVIISISWDSDDAKWRDFIDKNEMTWVQYRDADHALSKAFGIDAIPHYFTIDADGVLTAEMLGSGSDVEGKLKKLIAKAREAQPAAVASNSNPGS